MGKCQLGIPGWMTVALVVGLAGCSSAPLTPPSRTPSARVGVQADGAIAGCRRDDVRITTTVSPVGAPRTTEVDITVRLVNQADFGCTLIETGCGHGDPDAYVVDEGGAVVWSPGSGMGCPAPPANEVAILAPHMFRTVSETWDLSDCGPAFGCSATNAAAGTYRAVGTSDTAKVSSQSAPFTIP